MSVILIAVALAIVAGLVALIVRTARGALLRVSWGGNLRAGYRYHYQRDHMTLSAVVADELPAVKR
jgi:hypothetical protein